MKKFIKVILIILGSIVGIFVLLFIAAAIAVATGNAPKPSMSPSDTSSPVEVKPTPINSVIDTTDKLQEAIVQKLGKETNRDGVLRNVVVELNGENNSELYITYAMDDNFTEKMTIGQGWSNVEDIITIARQSTFAKNITITGTMELLDKYGNSLGERNIFTPYFDDTSFASINTENLVGEMYSDAATSVFIHPLYRS